MSDDGRRTIREQQEMYRRYMATLPRTGEPWYIHPRMNESWNPPTLAERIDRLERDLKMGKYADPIVMHNYDSDGGDDASL